MAKNTKNISQNVIIPKSCHEKYLQLDRPFSSALTNSGVTNAGVSRLTAGYEILRSQPSTHVVLFITKGSLQYIDANKKTAVINAGSRLSLPYNVFEHYWCDDELEMFWFHLRGSEMWKGLTDIGLEVREIEWLEEFRDAVNRYINESELSSDDSTNAASHYASLISTYLKRELTGGKIETRKSVQQSQLESLLKRIEDDLSSDWSIDRLAREIYASPSQLHRLCKSIYNTSPMGLVRELRLSRAHDILHNTDYPLNVIADIVGYETPFALSKAFKSQYSISPSSMRKLEKAD